jgi:hypothetical protein
MRPGQHVAVIRRHVMEIEVYPRRWPSLTRHLLSRPSLSGKLESPLPAHPLIGRQQLMNVVHPSRCACPPYKPLGADYRLATSTGCNDPAMSSVSIDPNVD